MRARGIDLFSRLLCGLVQAFLPTPASRSELVGKASVIVASTLTLAVHVIWVHPFAPAHAWKGPVRAALLVLAAAAAAIVAWAGALDLRIVEGTRATNALTAGAYALVALFCIVVAVLVGGVASAMLRGLREENAKIRATALALSSHSGRRHVGRGARDALQLEDQTGSPPHSITVGGQSDVAVGAATDNSLSAVSESVNAATPGPMADVAFAVLPVRRIGDGIEGFGASGRRRQRQNRRTCFLAKDSVLAAAAAALLQPRAIPTDAEVCDACDGIVSSLSRLSAADASNASAAFLPGLSARLDAALRDGGGSPDSGAVIASVCRAMAALSDHADATLLSRLGATDAPKQIAAVLRRWMEVSPPMHHTDISQALWLLGNLAADEGVATAFTAAGGAALLATLLSSSWASPASAALHACVAAASIAAHSDAAAGLLDAGVLRLLAQRLVFPNRDDVVGESRVPGSIADAEAACCAISTILGHIKTGVHLTRAVSLACEELAASDVVAGCTAALRQQAGPRGNNHRVDDVIAPLTLHAAGALLSVVRCARSAEAEAAAVALADQAATAGTEEAVATLLRRHGGASEILISHRPDDSGAAAAALPTEQNAVFMQSLETLSEELRRWLSGTASS